MAHGITTVAAFVHRAGQLLSWACMCHMTQPPLTATSQVGLCQLSGNRYRTPVNLNLSMGVCSQSVVNEGFTPDLSFSSQD